MEEGKACYFEKQLMFISKFLSDTNFGLALFTLLVYLTTNYNDKMDYNTNSDGDRTNWFETTYLTILIRRIPRISCIPTFINTLRADASIGF